MSDILVVGGGAAGLSAALAASKNASVAIVDDNPLLGGQIWRAELGKVRSADASRLIALIDEQKVTIVNNAQVFAAAGEKCLVAETPKDVLELNYENLVIATGARERFLPFPGWTLPNVFGAGGLQAMVKGGVSVAGKRVIVSGTGALLIAAASYLKSKGSQLIAIAEQAHGADVNRFALGLWHSPSKLLQAAAMRTRLAGIPYLTDCWVTSAKGETFLEQVTLTRKNKTWDVDCDLLACGFHLVPNLELASLLGCKIENETVVVNELQQTSIKNIFCAGEPTGVAGVESSLIEGKIAGLAAVGLNDEARSLFRKRDKAKRFGKSLNMAFALRNELKELANDETMVCRCEDVEYGRLAEFDKFSDAKLQTRCGMGPCQGRVCGPATKFLFGWESGTVRPPIFPVRMENL